MRSKKATKDGYAGVPDVKSSGSSRPWCAFGRSCRNTFDENSMACAEGLLIQMREVGRPSKIDQNDGAFARCPFTGTKIYINATLGS
jgi:hypothetical protein